MTAQEAIALIASLQDMAFVGEPTQESCRQVGVTKYQFDPTGHAMIRAPDRQFAARCEPTGSVQARILNAVGGN